MKSWPLPYWIGLVVLRALLALALLGAIAQVRAQDEAEDEAVGGDGADYVQLLYERQVTLRANGEKTVREHHRLKVLKPAAIEYLGEVQVSYNSYRSKAKFLRGSTVLPDGRELQVDPRSVRDAQDAGMTDYLMYEDVRELSFSMPAVRVDAILDYEVETRYHRPILKGEVSDAFEIDGTVATSSARYVVTAPKKTDLLIRPRHTAVQPTEEAGFLSTTRTWEFSDIPQLSYEPGMASYFDQQTAIEVTTLRSWDRVQQWYADLAESAFALDDDVRAKVAELTADKATDVEKIRALFLFMQRDIRYVGIELGLSAYQPHPATDCFRNRYGDCKDQAVLLTAMLRQVGIESYLALLRIGGGAVDQEFPDVGQFNHVVVYVPRADGPLWLDATGKYLDEASHPYQLDGAHALIVGGPEGMGFVTIEPPAPERSCERTIYDVQLMASGHCRVQEIYEYVGRTGADSRVEFENLDPKERQENVDGYVLGMEAALVSYGNSDPHDLAQPFREWVIYERDGFLESTADGYTLSLTAEDASWLLDLPQPRKRPGEARATRVHPWVSRHGASQSTTYVLHLPPGVAVGPLPPSSTMDLLQGSIRLTAAVEGRTVTAESYVERRPCTIQAADYDLQRVRTDRALGRASLTLTFADEVTRLLQGKQPEAARALAAKLVAENPADVDAHLALAGVCHSIGRLVQARKEYREALRLDPKRLAVYQSLAMTYGGFDGVYGVGYDREQVVAIAREAVAAALDRRNAQLFLGQCLERDDKGEVRGPDLTDYAAAIAVYEQMLAERPDDLEPLTRIAECHYSLGEYAKAEDCFNRILRKEPDNPSGRAGQWVCAACQGRTDEAISAIRTAYEDKDERAEELSRVSGFLMKQRKYAALLEFMDSRVAILGQKDPRQDSIRALIAKVASGTLIDNRTYCDLTSPETAFNTLLSAVLTDDPDRVRRCLSPRLGLSDDDMAGMGGIGEVLDATIGTDSVLDISRQIWVYERTPLPGGMLKLEAKVPRELASQLGNQSKQVTVFCETAPDGTWRICCLGSPEPEPADLARLALSFLDQGDTAAAKHYGMMIQRDFLRGRTLFSEPNLRTELADLKYPDIATFVKAMAAASLPPQAVVGTADGGEPTGLRFARELATRMPDSLPIQRVLANQLYATEHYGESLAVREAIAVKSPKDKLLVVETLGTLRKLHRYRDALAAADRLGQLMPAADVVDRIKLDVLIEAGEDKEGLKLLGELSSRWRPDQVRSNEVRLQAMSGGRTRLLVLANEISQSKDTDSDDLLGLVSSLRHAGLHQRALALTEVAVSDKTSPELLITLCNELLLTGDLDEARDIFDRLCRTGEMDGPPAHYLACLGIGLGRFTEAEQLFADCLEGVDVDSRTYAELLIGVCRVLRGEIAAGKEAIARADAWQYDAIWPKPVLQYFAGQATLEDMLATAKRADTQVRRDQFLCEAYFYAAIRARMDGDEARYRDLLRQAADTHSFLTMECSIAHGLLGITVPPDGD